MSHCMRLKFIYSEKARKLYELYLIICKLNLISYNILKSLKWVTKFKAGKQDPTAGTAEHSSIVFRRSTSQRKKKLSKGSCNCIRNGMTYIFIYIHTPFHACFIIFHTVLCILFMCFHILSYMFIYIFLYALFWGLLLRSYKTL